jgi:hypothetical protein
VCREANLTPPRFYRVFKNLEGFCERAGIKIDRETLVRIKGTRKATRQRTRGRSQGACRDSTPTMTVKSESTVWSAPPTFEEIQQNLKDEEEARQLRLENVGKFAAQIEILALDGDPQISDPVVDALSGVVPSILKKRFGVDASLKDLVEASDVLHQARELKQELRAKEIQLDGLLKKHEQERLEIQDEWEKIRQARKLDPGKVALQNNVKTLQGEKKVLIDDLNEAFNDNKRFRLAVVDLLTVIGECNSCKKRFHQVLEPYPDLKKWLLDGKWALSFEVIDMSRLPSRT